MRLIYFLFLVAFAGAVGLLAYENRQDITLAVLNNRYTTSVPILLGSTFLAGMLGGWTIVGLIRRSFNRVVQGEPSYSR
jgi:hypothetical protein